MTKSDNKAIRSQLIQVDAGKLAKGLKTTFEGVALVFDSIGIDVDFDITKTQESGELSKQSSSGKEENNACEETGSGSGKYGSDDNNSVDDVPASAVAEEVDEKSETDAVQETDTGSQVETEKVVSSIAQDDITKVIVQKIKKDRSNNEKIGQILKAYGVAKVGELPESKFEAFLTDLAEL